VSDPIRLAVLGDPLEYTLSPELHRAGFEALGIRGESRAIRTALDQLPPRLDELSRSGYLGVNLTHPLKQAACAAVSLPSDQARRADSVNTIGFDAAGWWGESTDGIGFLDLLASLGRPVSGARVVSIGAGGAARALAVALIDAGAQVTFLARRPESTGAAIAGVTTVALEGAVAEASLREADVVVNATPVSTATAPVAPSRLSRGSLIVDLVYRRELSEWTTSLRDSGLQAYDGLGLLVFQARRALARWFGRDPGVEPLARAVGWPR
jgi:shikimate dehydrogenase